MGGLATGHSLENVYLNMYRPLQAVAVITSSDLQRTAKTIFQYGIGPQLAVISLHISLGRTESGRHHSIRTNPIIVYVH